MDLVELDAGRTAVRDRGDRAGGRAQHPHDHATVLRMSTEDGMRVRMLAADECVEL
jgi:hypothetical protein